MKSILSELYEGKIFPAEQYSPRSEEYRKIYQEHYQHYDDFIETLSKAGASGAVKETAACCL